MKTAADVLKEKGQELICVDADSTIEDAIRVMVERRIGAILVRDKGKIVGIWTERDLMRNTVAADFNPATARIRESMVTGLQSASHTDTIYSLLDKFLGRHLRHLLVEENQEYVGILSTGDVIKACLNEKMREVDELNSIASWEYYDNWSWKQE